MSDSKIAESILFCFCGPSGSGKSTICEELLKRDRSLSLSVSSTSRVSREGEVNGVDYNFLSKPEFEERIQKGELIEYTVYNGNYYGTEKRTIDKAISLNRDLLLDIEVQGVGNIKKLFPERVVTVFVFPPSFETLVRRLRERGTESEAQLANRLKIARNEISVLTSPGFSDYLLVNDVLESAVESARWIISTERQRFSRLRQAELQRIFAK